MVKLKCRSCGGEVDSNEKARKCRHCNELLPFECGVCSKKLRPPIPEFPVERYYNEALQPLCADHYQRECPECNRWFRADENPGFYLCPDCTQQRENGGANDVAEHDHHDTPSYKDENVADDDDDEEDDRNRAPRARAKAGTGCAGVFVLMLSVSCAPLAWFCARALWG